MPQTVRIDAAQPRREVEQLHAHSKHNPRDRNTRVRCPNSPALAILAHTEPRPESILHHPADHVCRHVVRVVPVNALQVTHVHDVEQSAEQSPSSQNRAASRRGDVESEDANGGEIHAIQHIHAGSEIVQLFRDLEVSRVKDRTEDPTSYPDICKADVEWSHRI